ncbi:MAG: RagB/SusD family nutrient uptake outer membrane protein [Tannerellaceae bacterium]|jgi:hypothetical protein|nr:RagB/SusD family nutrient uptake outer membrane protein [Tannerellaceae bacterium]
MKKISWILISIYSVAAILTSCADFLDKEPDDMLTLEMVFDDKKRTEEWLATIYTQVPDLLSESNFTFRILSDDLFISPELQQFGASFVVNAIQGNWNPLTDMSIDVWNNGYKAIRSAYIFMQNVKALPEQGVSERDAEFMRMEARFLIAYIYSRILSFHGPCPLITELVPPSSSVEELMRTRTPFEEIVNILDKELMELSAFFPEVLPQEAMQFGRPTKGICLAVRARLLLYAASPLFNGNPDYTDVVNPDGTPLFPQSYDPDKWRKAADATRLLLDVAEKGVYNLYVERYSNGEIDPFLSFQNLFLTTAETNKEIIFGRASVDYNWARRTQPRNIGGSGFLSPPQGLVDKFFMRNGLPITAPNSGYTETGFTSEPIFYENTSYDLADEERTKGLVVGKDVFNMYANREPRFYISIRYNNQYIPAYNLYTQLMFNQAAGRPNHDSPQCGYLPRKGVSPNDLPRTSAYPYRPGIIFRLGEFYLNYAEALNECDPGNPEILKYVNLIRERASIPQYGNGEGMISPPSGQDNIRELIWTERRVELCLEGEVRYNDIRRWKIAEEIFSEPLMGMNAYGATPEEYYVRTIVTQPKFDKKMYLWPIKQTFIDNNPNLIQNKFW